MTDLGQELATTPSPEFIEWAKGFPEHFDQTMKELTFGSVRDAKVGDTIHIDTVQEIT